MSRITLTILLACLPLSGYAQLYKCKRPDGTSTFQDTECPAGASSSKIVAPAAGSAQSMTLFPDSHGHYRTRVTINNVEVEGLIDTGASVVAISTATAHSMGIPFSGGTMHQFQTANGPAIAYIKVMPMVKVGNIEMYNVEVAISDQAPTLIGMSALGQFKISQENGQMILTKR
jgi:aspartyl protease family protein